MGLWLFDAAGNATAEIAEYGSVITTERYREYSEFSGMFSPSDYDYFAAAYFAQMSGEPEIYLVEKLTLKTGRDSGLEVSGRSAAALLATRALVGMKSWDAMTAGSMISDMMDDFTAARVLSLAFGTGTAVGSTFSLQRSWGDCGAIALEILAAQSLGMRTRMDGTDVKLDVYGPTDIGVNLGEKFADGSTARLITDETSWRNYAYVLGEDDRETSVGNIGANCSVAAGTLSGSFGNLNAVDEYTLNVTENASTGLEVVLGFGAVPEGSSDVMLSMNAYYDGMPGHYLRVQVAEDGANYVTVQELAFDGAETQYRDVEIPLGVTALATTGRVRIQHCTATYNSGHKFYINMAKLAFNAPREQVVVDQTSGAERREVYVDANDIKRDDLSLAQYQALLAARGATALAETRRLEYAEAEAIATALRAGDIVWYDAGAFGASFMATEVVSTYEGGNVTRSIGLGDPPATLARSLRRYLQ